MGTEEESAQEKAPRAMNLSNLDERPVIVAIAGSNGSGKTTFYHAHLRQAGLRYINADLLARELKLEPYTAAEVADALRRQLMAQRESFIFETVFSDPVGDKLSFLHDAIEAGFTVVLCFIGIANSKISEQRVAMRASQGGHDVPTEKLKSRFPRTLVNLKRAMQELPVVFIYDNNDLNVPFRLVAVVEKGQVTELSKPVPRWLRPLLK